MNKTDLITPIPNIEYRTSQEVFDIMCQRISCIKDGEPVIEQKPTPVMKDGKLENFMIKQNGKPFRCNCGCNVFHKPDDTRPELYRCNSCMNAWVGV